MQILTNSPMFLQKMFLLKQKKNSIQLHRFPKLSNTLTDFNQRSISTPPENVWNFWRFDWLLEGIEVEHWREKNYWQFLKHSKVELKNLHLGFRYIETYNESYKWYRTAFHRKNPG